MNEKQTCKYCKLGHPRDMACRKYVDSLLPKNEKQTWQEVEQEFDEKFNFESLFGKKSEARKNVLSFFKQKFQQNLHDDAVKELENVDNTNTKL